MSEFDEWTTIELAALFDAFYAAKLGFRLIRLQPRAAGDAVAARLDAEIERCIEAMRGIVDEVSKREPCLKACRDTCQDATAEIIVRWGLIVGDWAEVKRGYAAAVELLQTPATSSHSNTR